MRLWRAERFNFLEEAIAFLNTRQLESHQFKVVVASDNAQQPYIVFVLDNEAPQPGEAEAETAVAESSGAIEVAEAIVADAQRNEE